MENIKVLIFKLNNEYFATDIKEVERILGDLPKIQLPDSPEFLEGIIKYENEVIPVINLYKKFKFRTQLQGENKRIIVVKKDIGKFGILVDDVSEVKDITIEVIDKPQSVANIIEKEYIKGIIKEDNKLTILLNLNNILTVKEEEMVIERMD